MIIIISDLSISTSINLESIVIHSLNPTGSNQYYSLYNLISYIDSVCKTVNLDSIDYWIPFIIGS